MKAFFIALSFALLNSNIPANQTENDHLHFVNLPYGITLFISDNGTEEKTDDFVFDFDIR